jgi:hypothetical protein
MARADGVQVLGKGTALDGARAGCHASSSLRPALCAQPYVPSLMCHVKWPIRRRESEQAGVMRGNCRLGAIVDVQLAVKSFHVHLDRGFGQIQIAGDFLVGFASAQAL